jgi:UDP-N-acetylmuramoyl-L-alanyl-D-glutamate--2,6-diaminopimelate ligase
MRLRQVLVDSEGAGVAAQDRDVAGLCSDSRHVRPGDVFFALAGSRTDGARYITDAVIAGAVAIVAETLPTVTLPDSVACIQVTNARRSLALAAARVFPRQPGTIAAVTGTSGKTSVAAFVRQIWERLGHAAASIGTVGVVAPSGDVYGSLTTPGPIELHRTLDRLAGEGVTHLAIEASSHGLDQHRLDGLRLSVAAFTNISRDHLDYHPSVEAYVAAKQRLFADLIPPQGVAVVNADSDHGSAFIDVARQRGLRVLKVGGRGDAITLIRAERDGFAQQLRVSYDGREYVIQLPMVGDFQIENALVAAGMAIASGGPPAAVFAALEHLRGAKGRLEHVGTRNSAPVFVDYAHKPDALSKTLDALRPYVTGKLVLVFGAGGDRDRGKRPLMGEIAAAKADRVIVTDDNPRSEDPAAIRREILAAAPGAQEIGDRAQAIREAITGLRSGDVLVVAGKGHESGQIVGNRVLPFSDHEAVAAALGEVAA